MSVIRGEQSLVIFSTESTSPDQSSNETPVESCPTELVTAASHTSDTVNASLVPSDVNGTNNAVVSDTNARSTAASVTHMSDETEYIIIDSHEATDTEVLDLVPEMLMSSEDLECLSPKYAVEDSSSTVTVCDSLSSLTSESEPSSLPVPTETGVTAASAEMCHTDVHNRFQCHFPVLANTTRKSDKHCEVSSSTLSTSSAAISSNDDDKIISSSSNNCAVTSSHGGGSNMSLLRGEQSLILFTTESTSPGQSSNETPVESCPTELVTAASHTSDSVDASLVPSDVNGTNNAVVDDANARSTAASVTHMSDETEYIIIDSDEASDTEVSELVPEMLMSFSEDLECLSPTLRTSDHSFNCKTGNDEDFIVIDDVDDLPSEKTTIKDVDVDAEHFLCQTSSGVHHNNQCKRLLIYLNKYFFCLFIAVITYTLPSLM